MTNNNTLKSLLFLAFLLPFATKSAQIPFVKQVIVANGGSFSNPTNKITLTAYDPATKKDTLFDSIPGKSVTQVLVDSDGTAYVATDSTLVKYDLNTLKKLQSMQVFSIRYLAFYKDKICATIGFDGNFNNFKMFNKSDLSLVYKERNLKTTWCEGLTIVGDSAYVAMQGTYPYSGDTGKIGVLDLVNMKVKRTIVLSEPTKGVAHMFAGNGYVVATTENFPPTLSYISKVDLKTGAITIVSKTQISVPFALYHDTLYAGFPNGLGSYNLKSATSALYIQPAPDFLAGALDTINKLFYLTGDDFTNPTKTHIYDYKGKVLDSFKVGVAPQAIAILYGKKSGINQTESFGTDAQLFPNPANTAIYLTGFQAKEATVAVMDIAGKLVYSKNLDFVTGHTFGIPVDGLPNGIYIVNIKSSTGSFSRKFVKN